MCLNRGYLHFCSVHPARTASIVLRWNQYRGFLAEIIKDTFFNHTGCFLSSYSYSLKAFFILKYFEKCFEIRKISESNHLILLDICINSSGLNFILIPYDNFPLYTGLLKNNLNECVLPFFEWIFIVVYFCFLKWLKINQSIHFCHKISQKIQTNSVNVFIFVDLNVMVNT